MRVVGNIDTAKDWQHPKLRAGLALPDDNSQVAGDLFYVVGTGLFLYDGTAWERQILVLGNGVVFLTPEGTITRELQVVQNQLSVTNRDGINGDPSFGLADNPRIPGKQGLVLPSGTDLDRPQVADVGLIRFNTQRQLVEYFDGTTWIISTIGPQGLKGDTGPMGPKGDTGAVGVATSQDLVTMLGYTPVNRAGDVLTGSLGMPSDPTKGLKINTDFGWKDLIGDVAPKPNTGQAPVQKLFLPNIRGWAYSAGDQGDLVYHVPHDYAVGTDLFFHVHWGHNGTNISGTFRLDLFVTYAKGHQQANFSAALNPAVVVGSLNMTIAPQYRHRVDEIQLSTHGGSASLLDTNQIEVDGLIMISYTVTTIPSISGSATANSPFIFTADLHYQSTGLSTKNKSPNFYS